MMVIHWAKFLCIRKVYVILYIIFASALFSNAESAKNKFLTIRELCRAPEVGSRGHSRMLEGAVLTSEGERDVNCEFTFQTDTILQRFMLRFERLQLDCNDHLFIYDGAYVSNTYKVDLSCRNTMQNVGTIYTHSNHITLKYVTDQWGPATNGFKLIVTAFKDKQTTCLAFRCQKTNFCISRGLTCDGFDHCGDHSDESTSFARCPSAPFEDLLRLSGPVVATLATCTAIAFCGLCVGVGFCLVRRNRLRALHMQQQRGAMQPNAYSMDMSGIYGTNGTFGSMVSEKVLPSYPAHTHPQHTVILPPGSVPGNLARPTSGVGTRALLLRHNSNNTCNISNNNNNCWHCRARA